MQTLDTISNDAKQKHTILLAEDNSRIVLDLTYKPTQLGWFVDVIYETLGIQIFGLRVTTNTNILDQWRNILPFGLLCTCEDEQEPLLLDDFIVGRAKLHILSAEDVQTIIKMQQDK